MQKQIQKAVESLKGCTIVRTVPGASADALDVTLSMPPDVLDAIGEAKRAFAEAGLTYIAVCSFKAVPRDALMILGVRTAAKGK